jgi:hypothetical protein
MKMQKAAHVEYAPRFTRATQYCVAPDAHLSLCAPNRTPTIVKPHPPSHNTNIPWIYTLLFHSHHNFSIFTLKPHTHTLINKLLTHPNNNTIHPTIQPSNQLWLTLPPHPSPSSNPSSRPPTPAQKATPSCPPAPKPRAPSPHSPKTRTTTSPPRLCSRPATTSSTMIASTSRTKTRAGGRMRSSWTTRVRVDVRGSRLRRGGSE